MVDRIIVLLIELISKPVYASVGNPGGSPDWPPKLDAIAASLSSLLEKVYPFGVLLAVGVLILGGYMWIISGGDPSRKQLAQGTLTWGVIGLVFLFLIRAILTLVVNNLYN